MYFGIAKGQCQSNSLSSLQSCRLFVCLEECNEKGYALYCAAPTGLAERERDHKLWLANKANRLQQGLGDPAHFIKLYYINDIHAGTKFSSLKRSSAQNRHSQDRNRIHCPRDRHRLHALNQKTTVRNGDPHKSENDLGSRSPLCMHCLWHLASAYHPELHATFGNLPEPTER